VDLGRFFRRRAWRILPPYYVALVVFVLLRLVMGRPAEAGDIVTHALMVHNLWPQWMGSINGAFWSLALECQLYLVFPLLLFGFRRLGLAPVLIATLAMTLLYRSWVWATIDVSELGQAYYWCYSLPGRLFEFVLGMTAAILQARGSAWQAPARQRSYLIGMLASGALAAGVTVGISPFSPVSDVLWGAAFFCLVMYAGARSATGAPILTGRLLVGLGIISYSIYLIHAPLLRLLGAAARSTALPPLLRWLSFELLLVPLLIALGWLFYRLVESRFIGTDTRKPPGSEHRARAPARSRPWIGRLLPSGLAGRE
jgi:peptidoglycan/LPS O-acetylase OafA/YrhL